MATEYYPSQTLGRGDLSLLLTDSVNNPANAAEITYALYYYDTTVPIPVEVLIGDPARVPVNPQIGEYYAAIQIPLTAVAGEYRIKWSFRQYVSSALQQVVQVFTVVGSAGALAVTSHSLQVQQFINKLRLHLRDQCLGGEEEVELDVAGEKMTVRLDDLWEAVQDGTPDNPIRLAFKEGALKTPAVSPEGKIEWKRVTQVNRAEVPWETIYEGTTAKGSFVLTAGHRIFCNPDGSNKLTMEEVAESGTGTCMLAVSASEEDPFNPGHGVFSWGEPLLGYLMLHAVRKLESRQFMFDLTTEDWHNFILVQSRVVVSNSPDKFYHFRPPEHDGEIGQYNKVFGQIWEDAELYEYLESALDTWNTLPPFTGNMMPSLDRLLSDRPAWRSAILWSAISWACFALMANWSADEFSYSIGGISLDIEKSSKYQTMKDSADQQFDKFADAKSRTVKFLRGLQQPKFGVGIRSSFGPSVGRGILSPRSFMVWAIGLLPFLGFLMSIPGLTT